MNTTKADLAKKLENSMNSFPKGKNQFEPGVRKFIEKDERKDIVEVIKETTSENSRYCKPIKPHFKAKETETKTFIPWEDLKMEKFDIVQDGKTLGLVDETGNIIIKQDQSKTTVVRGLIKLCFVNIKAFAYIYNTVIVGSLPLKERKSKKMLINDDWYHLKVGHFGIFLKYYFPNDYEHIIRKANKSEILDSIYTNVEINPVRKKRPLGLITMKNENSRKTYLVNKVVEHISLIDFNTLIENSARRPHYSIKSCETFFNNLGKVKDPEKKTIVDDKVEDHDFIKRLKGSSSPDMHEEDMKSAQIQDLQDEVITMRAAAASYAETIADLKATIDELKSQTVTGLIEKYDGLEISIKKSAS